MVMFRDTAHGNSQAIIDKANQLWDNIYDKGGATEQPDVILVAKDEFYSALQELIDELHGMSLCVGKGLSVYGDYESISRTQGYVLLDTTHPIEREDVKRQFARALQMVERAQGAPVGTLHHVKAS